MRKKGILFLLISGLFLSLFPYRYAEGDVIILIQERQKEKKASRWTLSDWMRLKQRMRQMDLWLAMHTNPDDAHFRPELSVDYAYLGGDEDLAHGGVTENFSYKDNEKTHYELSSKLFLNDIVSATLGIPTLNIDIGFAGFYRKARVQERGYGAVLRFLGSHNQDTSFDVAGYLVEQEVLIPSSFNFHPSGPGEFRAKIKSWLFQADLQFYILSFFGLQGSYRYFAEGNSYTTPTIAVKGSGWSAHAFLELWILRVSAGLFSEEKKFMASSGELIEKRDGFLGKAGIYF